MPRVFGTYVLHRTIGHGSSATVVAASSPDGERVALKIPHAHLQSDAIEREASLARSVRSPHVVSVLGVAREGRDRALVLELVEGLPLSSFIADGAALEWPVAARIGLDLALGLAAIHGATRDGQPVALVHGDVSPSNVLVRTDGTGVLTDLGLARRRALTALSASGAVHGTLGYVAPEVIRGAPPSARSDVFGLGVVIHELVTGGRAFDGRSDVERLRATVEQRLNVTETPLAATIVAATSKRPERRPADGAALSRTLESLGGIGDRAAVASLLSHRQTS